LTAGIALGGHFALAVRRVDQRIETVFHVDFSGDHYLGHNHAGLRSVSERDCAAADRMALLAATTAFLTEQRGTANLGGWIGGCANKMTAVHFLRLTCIKTHLAKWLLGHITGNGGVLVGVHTARHCSLDWWGLVELGAIGCFQQKYFNFLEAGETHDFTIVAPRVYKKIETLFNRREIRTSFLFC